MRFRNQADLDAHARSVLCPIQQVTFDQLMNTGTWKVNKSTTDTYSNQSIVWLQAKSGPAIIAIDLEGKIQRPVKGTNSVKFSSRTLKRIY
jgi:hypothetical protein